MPRAQISSRVDAHAWSVEVPTVWLHDRDLGDIEVVTCYQAQQVLAAWQTMLPSRRAWLLGGDGDDGNPHALVLAWWAPADGSMAVSMATWMPLGEDDWYSLADLPIAGVEIQRVEVAAAPPTEIDSEG